MYKFCYTLIKIVCILGLATILATETTTAKELAKLPKAPQRGTPDGSSTAGGSRTEPGLGNVCSQSNQSIAYLLDSNIRDYTSTPYPTFWFNIPRHAFKIANVEFALAESQTDKTIYRTKVKLEERTGIMGIALPQKEQYALKPDMDYTWHLQVDCQEAEQLSEVSLKGWVRRLSMNPDLTNELKSSSQKYAIYAENNILYDALGELIRLRQQNPSDREISQAWTKFLADLGKQDLAQQNFSIVSPNSY
jgi:Domain of Unknown Function (DUF928)